MRKLLLFLFSVGIPMILIGILAAKNVTYQNDPSPVIAVSCETMFTRETPTLSEIGRAAPGDQSTIIGSEQSFDRRALWTLSEIGRAAPGDQATIIGSEQNFSRPLTMSEIGRAAPGIRSFIVETLKC